MFVCLFVSLFLCFFVSLFLCFFVSLFLCFFVSWFLCFFVSLFLCFFVSWFLGFLVSWFLGFLVSWFLGLAGCLVENTPYMHQLWFSEMGELLVVLWLSCYSLFLLDFSSECFAWLWIILLYQDLG